MTTEQDSAAGPGVPTESPADAGDQQQAGREQAGGQLSRASERGAATRTGLLNAAREVFLTQGYAQAGVTDIVARAGASVGSLYHHYTGKAELYFALFDDLHREQAERTRNAARQARDAGVTDPMELFLAGARGYLDACIDQREISRMFSRGDGPPGFEDARKERVTKWVSRNSEFFARRGDRLDESVAMVMTGAMIVAVAEVSRAEDAERARSIADGVISVLSRLITPPAAAGPAAGAAPEPGEPEPGE